MLQDQLAGAPPPPRGGDTVGVAKVVSRTVGQARPRSSIFQFTQKPIQSNCHTGPCSSPPSDPPRPPGPSPPSRPRAQPSSTAEPAARAAAARVHGPAGKRRGPGGESAAARGGRRTFASFRHAENFEKTRAPPSPASPPALLSLSCVALYFSYASPPLPYGFGGVCRLARRRL